MTIETTTFSRRTDDITVINWRASSNGTEEMVYLQNELGVNWEVTLETWRTITCTDGAQNFSIDRGGFAAKGADNKWVAITQDQLKLFFQES